jgi:indolepyruvate ferredoxin oxidoreductase, alpha subunit
VRRFVTGLEAVARGAYEEGVHLLVVNARRPLDLLAAAAEREGAVRVDRAATARLAIEFAVGAALAGGRAVAAVASIASAADLLAAAASAGVGGLVAVAVDDPALALAPGDADARVFARAAKVPCVEPADAAGCREAVGAALRLSERWGTPVVVRLTTRLALSGAAIALRARRYALPAGRRVAFAERALLPEHGRAQRRGVDERLAQLAAHGADTDLNTVELRSAELGVVASGMAARHVREALPDASILTLGLSWPVPTELVRDFAGRVKRLVVAEEMEPLLEAELRADGIACEGKDLLPRHGELLPDVLRRALGAAAPRSSAAPVPPRPAEACPGCPHRPVLHALKRLHVAAIADLGCAVFGGRAPLGGVEVALAPSGAVAIAHGLGAALGARGKGRVVALVGESGLAADAGAVAHAVAAGSGAAVVAVTHDRADATAALAAALGAPARTVDAFDVGAVEGAVAEALRADRPALVVARGRCARTTVPPAQRFRVEPSRCNRCGACLRLGCPAIAEGEGTMVIDAHRCAGCGVCGQVCRARAIERGSAP